MSRRNSRARRDARYNEAIRRAVASGHNVTDYLRPGDSADRHARPCEPCGGTGDERWPNAAGAGWVWSGKDCPTCGGTGAAR